MLWFSESKLNTEDTCTSQYHHTLLLSVYIVLGVCKLSFKYIKISCIINLLNDAIGSNKCLLVIDCSHVILLYCTCSFFCSGKPICWNALLPVNQHGKTATKKGLKLQYTAKHREIRDLSYNDWPDQHCVSLCGKGLTVSDVLLSEKIPALQV